MSNAPTVLFGEMPLSRAVVRSATTDTATTITPDDSGSLFVNLSTSGNHTYTTPSVSDMTGKAFLFFNGQTSYALYVTGGTADKIMHGDNTGADTIWSSAETGEWAIVFGDGTYIYALTGGKTAWTASG